MVSAGIWFLVFPSAHHISMMARLPPELRDATRQADITDAFIYMGGISILRLAAIVLVFSGNARGWFDRNDPSIRPA